MHVSVVQNIKTNDSAMFLMRQRGLSSISDAPITSVMR